MGLRLAGLKGSIGWTVGVGVYDWGFSAQLFFLSS